MFACVASVPDVLSADAPWSDAVLRDGVPRGAVSAETAAALVELARDFSPRYEVVRDDLVIIDVSGLGRLLGTPEDIADACDRIACERGLRVGIAVAATQTAAMVLGLARAGEGGRDGPVVVRPGEEAAALMPLSLDWLAALPVAGSAADAAYLRHPSSSARGAGKARAAAKAAKAQTAAKTRTAAKPQTAKTQAAQAQRQGAKAQTKPRSKHSRLAGWHYRLAPPPLPAETPSIVSKTVASTAAAIRAVERWDALPAFSLPAVALDAVPGVLSTLTAREREAIEARAELLGILDRWGLKTFGDFARLPVVDVFERLGDAGVRLQQITRGRDARPLVHTPPEEPFEATFALEWPIDRLEPLSFVVTRLLEPLCARLERADRAAAVLDTTLRLVNRESYTCRLELPATTRDVKILRTLVMLDLESHPPTAGIDRVTISIHPTPGRIVQHSLLTRALPPPEQLSTLVARLTAVMGEGRVGAPVLLDTHRPEAFEMQRFAPPEQVSLDRLDRVDRVARVDPLDRVARLATSGDDGRQPSTTIARRTLRRFRQPVLAQVTVKEGRPVHVTPQGLPGGPVTQSAGPWRTSGEWWKDDVLRADYTASWRDGPWDRDEWDVSLQNGSVYHLHHERAQAHWFVAGCYD